MKLRIVFWAVLLTIWPVSGQTVLRLSGSESMKDFGQRLSDFYGKKNAGVQITVQAIHTADSFAAMAAGKVEIVESSRRVLHSEEATLLSAQGKNYVELQVATEVAGIYLNVKNPVKELSLYDLRQVLSGGIKNWKRLGGNDAPISVYGRDESSSVRSCLEDEFMGDAEITSSVKTFRTNTGVQSAVGENVNGVGYGSVSGRVDARVKFLGIKASETTQAVSPSGDTIRAKQYKLVRPLYFYFAGRPKSEVLHFAEWVISPEGQLVVEAMDYYPLSATEREAGKRILSGQ